MYPGNLLHLIIRLSGRTQIAVVATVAVWQHREGKHADGVGKHGFYCCQGQNRAIAGRTSGCDGQDLRPRQRVELPPAGGQLHPTSGEM